MRDTRNRLLLAGALAAAVTLLAGCFPSTDGGTPPPASSPGATADDTPTPSTPASTPDPWAGHFDDTVRDGQGDYDSQFWGSFGDPGGVAAVRNEDQRIEPGAYTVEVLCAGAPQVQASFTDLEGDPVGEAVAVTCPGSAAVDVELVERGIIMLLDSQREPGAYLVRFTALD